MGTGETIAIVFFVFLLLCVVVIGIIITMKNANSEEPLDDATHKPPPPPRNPKNNELGIPVEKQDVPDGEYTIDEDNTKKDESAPPLRNTPPTTTTGGTTGGTTSSSPPPPPAVGTPDGKGEGTCFYGFEIDPKTKSETKCSLNPAFLNQYKLRLTDYAKCGPGLNGPDANGVCSGTVYAMEALNHDGCAVQCQNDRCKADGGDFSTTALTLGSVNVKCKLPNRSLITPGSSGIKGKDVCPMGYAGPSETGMCVTAPGTNKTVARFNCLKHGGEYIRVDNRYDKCDMSGPYTTHKLEFPCEADGLVVKDWYKLQEDDDVCLSRIPNKCFTQESGLYIPLSGDSPFAKDQYTLHNKAVNHCGIPNDGVVTSCWLNKEVGFAAVQDFRNNQATTCAPGKAVKWDNENLSGESKSVEPGDVCSRVGFSRNPKLICDPVSSKWWTDDLVDRTKI